MIQETLKEYLQDKTPTSFEMVGDTLLSVRTIDDVRAIDSDMSNIPAFTPTENITDFNMVGDIIFIKNLELNPGEINLISNQYI